MTRAPTEPRKDSMNEGDKAPDFERKLDSLLYTM